MQEKKSHRAMLLLGVFDVVAAFSRALARKLAMDFLYTWMSRQLGGPTNRSARKWSRHVMVSLSGEHSPRQQRLPHACQGAITQAAPRITQARATLTRVARP